MKGFRGKLLKVDLSTTKISKEPLNENYAKNYLGGAGYSCRYLHDLINKSTDPLSSDNVLMIMNGPLNGTFAPNTGRWVVCSKSPYTGIWGESNCGSWFGAEIKKAGYDGIIILGSSHKPIYLEVKDEEAELKDAKELWGKGTYYTTAKLKELISEPKAQVACIGPAGENLVKFANIISEERAAGRTGMGAILGFKKLKGIVVKGSKINLEVDNLEKLREVINRVRETVKASFVTQVLRDLGTSGAMDMYNVIGELPNKYFTIPQWEGTYNISGATMAESILVKNRFCHSCIIGCGRRIAIKEGAYKTDEIEGPEYETLVSFGSLYLNDNLGWITHINRICFDYGIDTISSGSIISCLTHHFKKGKLTINDLDGLELDWGNTEVAEKLLEKIVYREGIGNLLAEGSNAVAKKFKISQDEIATVDGMEVTYHDIRSNYGMAIAYGLGSKGPSHNLLDAYYVLVGVPLEEIGIKQIDKYSDNKDMAEFCSLLMDYRALYSSMIMCSFCNPLPSQNAKLIEYTTGLKFGLHEIKLYGERISNLKRLFNIKMGLNASEDRLPKILTNPFKEGGSAGKSPDFEKLKSLFYKYREWDPISGRPSIKKLSELDLDVLI
ncbi:MAG: aldehyde ferredoxin oxidoreductase family protein [Candidatus Thorarchaeota archaeon]